MARCRLKTSPADRASPHHVHLGPGSARPVRVGRRVRSVPRRPLLISARRHRLTAVVLDTDVVSAILKDRLPEHLDRLLAGRQLAITFVTVGELTQWTHLHRWGPARRAGLRAFFRSVVILNSSVDSASDWGDIQAAARLRGRPRPINDSWVAACCIVSCRWPL